MDAVCLQAYFMEQVEGRVAASTSYVRAFVHEYVAGRINEARANIEAYATRYSDTMQAALNTQREGEPSSHPALCARYLQCDTATRMHTGLSICTIMAYCLVLQASKDIFCAHAGQLDCLADCNMLLTASDVAWLQLCVGSTFCTRSGTQRDVGCTWAHVVLACPAGEATRVQAVDAVDGHLQRIAELLGQADGLSGHLEELLDAAGPVSSAGDPAAPVSTAAAEQPVLPEGDLVQARGAPAVEQLSQTAELMLLTASQAPAVPTLEVRLAHSVYLR